MVGFLIPGHSSNVKYPKDEYEKESKYKVWVSSVEMVSFEVIFSVQVVKQVSWSRTTHLVHHHIDLERRCSFQLSKHMVPERLLFGGIPVVLCKKG